MKRLTFFALLLLFSFGEAVAQEQGWKIVYSDKFHFTASFPGEPKQNTADLETAFGRANTTRWVLDVPGASYEISVGDMADLRIKMESKELASYYRQACSAMGGDTNSCFNANNDERFDELGTSGGFKIPGGRIEFVMFLVRNRLFVARVKTHGSIDRQTGKDIAKFLDEFLFIFVDGTEGKFKWGLPKGEGQDRKGQ